MKKSILLVAATTGFLLTTMWSANAYNGRSLNGKAVSVQFRWGDSWTVSEAISPWRGSLLVYTIQSSQVTRVDTIYKREQAFSHYAAFNFSGTKIAFIRLGQALSGNTLVTVNGGKSYVSIINPDGTGLTDLCELPAFPAKAEMFPLDWPSGDWIYYTRPHDTAHTYNGDNGSTVIWRVNSISKVNEKVCNLTDDGNGNEEMCNTIRRFSLSVKGDKMGLMYAAGGKAGCTADVINNHVNNIYTFPPVNGGILSSSIVGAAGCNISISPSGDISGSYFAGSHDELMLGTVGNGPGVPIPNGVWIDAPMYQLYPIGMMDGLAGNLTMWTGGFIGRGAELIRWSANSDKWVMQKIGNGFDGHSGDNDYGSNQVVCNFMDSVAINISKNAPTPYPYPTGHVFFNNDAGDLWVSDPSNNPSGDRYEDVQGRWHTVDGAVVGSHIAVLPTALSATTEKDSVVANKTVQVTNIGVGTLGAISTVVQYGSGASNWLSASVSGSQVTVQFTNVSLAINTYQATLVVYAAGCPDSAFIPVTLKIMAARTPENPSNAVQGLRYKFYNGSWFPTPNFDTITPVVSSGTASNFSLSAVPGASGDNFGISYNGYIDIPAQGTYTFYIAADDMARLSIGSTVVVSSDWLHKRSGSIVLKAGKHAAKVDFSEYGGGEELLVEWECVRAGIARQTIPATRLFNTGDATSVFSRIAQMSKPSTQSVLYNLQGKRVGVMSQGGKTGLHNTNGRGLFMVVPEKLGTQGSKPTMIIR